MFTDELFPCDQLTKENVNTKNKMPQSSDTSIEVCGYYLAMLSSIKVFSQRMSNSCLQMLKYTSALLQLRMSRYFYGWNVMVFRAPTHSDPLVFL